MIPRAPRHMVSALVLFCLSTGICSPDGAIMKRHVGSFTAWDAKARRYTIHHYVERKGVESRTNPPGTAGGVHVFQASDGRDVKRLAKGSYVIVDSLGEVPVHSDSPNAV